jgi:hypothetical protein
VGPGAAARGLVHRARRGERGPRRDHHRRTARAARGHHDRDSEAKEAAVGRISRFREETRDERITIAREAEHRFERKVAWGAASGETRALFTHVAAPVMTRLRQPERQVLDTLVEAGVARSRADALGWCVRLVGEHTEEWLEDLRGALTDVQRLREDGPAV